MLGGEHHGIGPVLLIARERRVAGNRRDAPATTPAGYLLGAFAKPRLSESARDLTHAVGTEVEGDHAVRRPDPRLLPHQRRLDELVSLATPVGIGDGLLATGRVVRRLPMHEHVVGPLGSIPAAVSVHRPVAAHDRADPRPGGAFEFPQEA